MKIVQIMPEFGLAGAEVMCENLIYELIKLGHKVTVVSMYNYHSVITERLEREGVEIRYLNKKPGLDLSIVAKISRILREIRPDVVHTHLYCAKYAIPASIVARVKHRVHTVHNIAEKENEALARKLNKFFFAHCKVIPVALSELIRYSIVKEYRIEKDNVPVIYNGINLSKCMCKDDYSIKGSFKILHIGRFSEQKNHIGLLNAFKQFHDKCSDSELWLVGDGEKRSEIEMFVNENGLDSSVKFFGLRNDVYDILHDADVFTLPSNYEGIPMTLIEAMGTGLPIVATAVGGIPDMLTNDVNALLVDNKTDAIANAFEQYFLSEDMRKTHGKSARTRSTAFSAITMASQYERVYKI